MPVVGFADLKRRRADQLLFGDQQRKSVKVVVHFSRAIYIPYSLVTLHRFLLVAFIIRYQRPSDPTTLYLTENCSTEAQAD